MESNVTLYAFPGSLCSQKVRLALAEKQVPYAKVFVDIELRLVNYQPWYMRLNPRGVVPTLVHGNRVVTDSARILGYIDENFEGPALVPAGSYERECMERWVGEQDRVKMRELSYASFTGMLGFMLRKISMPLRASKLRRLRDENPDLANVYDAKLEDVRQWRAEIASQPDVAAIRRDLEQTLRRVERQLEKTRHLAGDRYSLADVAWTCVLARLKMLGLATSLWGAGRLPRLDAYYLHLGQRPSFVAADIWESKPSGKARREILKGVIGGPSPSPPRR